MLDLQKKIEGLVQVAWRENFLFNLFWPDIAPKNPSHDSVASWEGIMDVIQCTANDLLCGCVEYALYKAIWYNFNLIIFDGLVILKYFLCKLKVTL